MNHFFKFLYFLRFIFYLYFLKLSLNSYNKFQKENSASFKAEITTLTRKLNNKEKFLEESKKNFEKNIEEYKCQMTDLIRFNDCSTIKIKELEDQRENLRDIVKKLENENLNLNSECRKKMDLYEIEKNSKDDIQNEYENLKQRVQILVQMFKDFQNIKENHKNKADKFFNNLFKFYKD